MATEIPLLKPISKNATMITISQILYSKVGMGGNGTPTPEMAGFNTIARTAKAMVIVIARVFILAPYDQMNSLII